MPGLAAVGEPVAAMASGAVAKPASDIAGLLALPLHAAGLIRTDPTAIKEAVQSGLTYQPRSAAGRAVTGALSYPGELVAKGARKAEEAIAPPATAGPGRAALGYGVREAIEQIPALLGAKGGAAAKAALPEREAALAREQSLAAPKDALRAQFQASGYITPPEHGIKALATGAVGKARAEKLISARNADTASRRFAEEVGIPADTPLTKEVIEARKDQGYAAYDRMTAAAGPQLQPTPQFQSSISSSLAKIDTALERNREANRPLIPVQRLLKSFEKQTDFPTAATLEDIKNQRRYAKEDFAAKRIDMGLARLGISNQLENMIESNLARSGQQGLVDQFKSERVKLAQLYLLDRITNPATGAVNLPKLAQLSETKAYKNTLTGAFDEAATFSKTYQKAAQRQTGEAPPRLTVLDALFAGSGVASAMFGHPGALGVAAAEIGGRLAVPWMAERGMLQNRAPAYTVGPGRRALPFALPAAGAAASFPPEPPAQ